MIKHIKGRGAQFNPKNRFEKLHIDPDQFEESEEKEDEKSERKIETSFFKDDSKSVISKNDSDDLDFNLSINPYRGCEHGCIYCYARPNHEFLGFSSGIDFETKIMVKENAPELLEVFLNRKNYKPDIINFSGNTDCYQPVERKLKITRKLLKICSDYGNPVSIITKNYLILRDLDILKVMSERNLVVVRISITTLDNKLTRIMEPRTAEPGRRLNIIKTLSENKIPVGVNIAPIIPGLTDKEIPSILKAAVEAGARFAGREMLRLPYSVKELFLNWLAENMPDRSDKIINQIKQIRSGKLNDYRPGVRFSGEGELADTINSLFIISCQKFGLKLHGPKLSFAEFGKIRNSQLNLFKS